MDEESQQCPISASVLSDGADALDAQRHVERIRVNELLRYVQYNLSRNPSVRALRWQCHTLTESSVSSSHHPKIAISILGHGNPGLQQIPR